MTIQENNTPYFKRAKHDREHPYVMISKSMFRDKSISPKAKGLLGYLLCLPDDWKLNIPQVAKSLDVGKDYIYSALSELIQNGYCKKQVIKQPGKFQSNIYEFSEEPIFKKISTMAENPPRKIRHGKPATTEYSTSYEVDTEQQQTETEKKDVVVVPDREEKERLLERFHLAADIQEEFLKKPLYDLKNNILALDEYVESQKSKGIEIDSLIGALRKFVTKNWFPKDETKISKEKPSKPSISDEEIQNRRDLVADLRIKHWELRKKGFVIEDYVTSVTFDSIRIYYNDPFFHEKLNDIDFTPCN